MTFNKTFSLADDLHPFLEKYQGSGRSSSSLVSRLLTEYFTGGAGTSGRGRTRTHTRSRSLNHSHGYSHGHSCNPGSGSSNGSSIGLSKGSGNGFCTSPLTNSCNNPCTDLGTNQCTNHCTSRGTDLHPDPGPDPGAPVNADVSADVNTFVNTDVCVDVNPDVRADVSADLCGDLCVDMSDIRCALIRRDLEQVEADLAAIRKSLSMAQEDFARAAREQEIREAEQEAALFERLKKEFADLPGPFLLAHSGQASVDPAQRFRIWARDLRLEGADPIGIINNRIATVARRTGASQEEVRVLLYRHWPGLEEVMVGEKRGV